MWAANIVGQRVGFRRLSAARATYGIVEGPLLHPLPSGGL